MARLRELGQPYGQHARLQVDIGNPQMHSFGDPQTGGGDQSEQRFIGRPPQAWSGTKMACCRQQIDDLPVAVDVRGQSLPDSAEGGVVGYLGVRLELP